MPDEELERRVEGLGELDAPAPDTVEVSHDDLRADFNCDGIADLAIGVPRDRASNRVSGSVNVIYGSGAGLAAIGGATDAQIWHAGVIDPGSADEDDLFGFAVAAGDFDGDECGDLAIGTPGDDVGGANAAGSVTVLYGSNAGLTGSRSQIWHQDSEAPGDDPIEDEAEPGDQFGYSLTTGDFDGNGVDDLAIGVVGEGILAASNAGAVNVIFGTMGDGLTSTGNSMLFQGSGGANDTADQDDEFGFALAAGDFDLDLDDDLAVGVPGEGGDAGAVHVFYGAGTGLLPADDEIYSQNALDISNHSEANDRFGHALAIGDFDGDSFADLACGVPFEDIDLVVNAGAVNIIYGSVGALTDAGDQIRHEGTTKVEGLLEANDQFGRSLAAGDFNGDGTDDLAVGKPGEDFGALADAGRVQVFYGGNGGVTGDRDEEWDQNAGIGGVAEMGDWFGSALCVGDFDGDDATDLAVGVALEDIGQSVLDAGWVNVIYGEPVEGLTQDRDQIWHQGIDGVLGEPEGGDNLGVSIR